MNAQTNHFAITLEGGERFFCREDECVLQAMIRARTGPIAHGCFGGGCGVCKMRVVQGEYQLFKRMSRSHISEEEEADGVLLICCIRPRSDLILHSIARRFHDSQPQHT